MHQPSFRDPLLRCGAGRKKILLRVSKQAVRQNFARNYSRGERSTMPSEIFVYHRWKWKRESEETRKSNHHEKTVVQGKSWKRHASAANAAVVTSAWPLRMANPRKYPPDHAFGVSTNGGRTSPQHRTPDTYRITQRRTSIRTENKRRATAIWKRRPSPCLARYPTTQKHRPHDDSQ